MDGLVGRLLGRLKPKATESHPPPPYYTSPKSGGSLASRPLQPLAASRSPSPGMICGGGAGVESVREGVKRVGRLSASNGARERPGRGEGKAGGKQ